MWIGITAGVVFLVTLGLLFYGWLVLVGLRGCSRPAPLRRVMLIGLGLHVSMLLVPPALSDDPLAYAAIGRAMSAYGRSASEELGKSLPKEDPYRQLIEVYPRWLAYGSAYGPGFNWLAKGAARTGGDNVQLTLRLFQALCLVSLAAAALVTAQAAREAAESSSRDESAARAAALVFLSPMALLEGTANAHNDSFLAVGMALFVLAAVRRRPIWAIAALCGAVAIKTIALLPLLFYLIHLCRSWILPSWRPKGASLIWMLSGVALVCTILFFWVAMPILQDHLGTTALLLGSKNAPYPMCTRSLECIPRALLHFVMGMPQASWYLGLLFRAASGVLLLYCAIRAQVGLSALGWMGGFLFLHLLVLQGWSQPWYTLLLLPLLQFAPRAFLPAMLMFCVSGPAHYALDFPLDCERRQWLFGLSEFVEFLMTAMPPSWLLWKQHKAGQLAAQQA